MFCVELSEAQWRGRALNAILRLGVLCVERTVVVWTQSSEKEQWECKIVALSWLMNYVAVSVVVFFVVVGGSAKAVRLASTSRLLLVLVLRRQSSHVEELCSVGLVWDLKL